MLSFSFKTNPKRDIHKIPVSKLSDEKNVKWHGWPGGGLKNVLKLVNWNANGISQLTVFTALSMDTVYAVLLVLSPLSILPGLWEKSGVKHKPPYYPSSLSFPCLTRQALHKAGSYCTNFLMVLLRIKDATSDVLLWKRIVSLCEVGNIKILLKQINYDVPSTADHSKCVLPKLSLVSYTNIAANRKASCKKIKSNICVVHSEFAYLSIPVMVTEHWTGATHYAECWEHRDTALVMSWEGGHATERLW